MLSLHILSIYVVAFSEKKQKQKNNNIYLYRINVQFKEFSQYLN